MKKVLNNFTKFKAKSMEIRITGELKKFSTPYNRVVFLETNPHKTRRVLQKD